MNRMACYVMPNCFQFAFYLWYFEKDEHICGYADWSSIIYAYASTSRYTPAQKGYFSCQPHNKIAYRHEKKSIKIPFCHSYLFGKIKRRKNFSVYFIQSSRFKQIQQIPRISIDCLPIQLYRNLFFLYQINCVSYQKYRPNVNIG